MTTAADLTRVHKSPITKSLLAALAVVGSPAWGDVTSSGDVSPTFTVGPVVALTGQRLLLGFTAGGQGTGFVTVNGAGSALNLAGGAGTSGFDVGSWGNGTLTISNGGLIACATVAACQFNSIGNAAGSTGRLEIVGGTVSGLGQLAVGLGNLLAGFGTAGANTSATLSITNGGALSSNGFNTVASNSGQTGIVTGNVTISGAGSNWSITRDLAGGGGQAFLGIAPSSNASANVTITQTVAPNTAPRMVHARC